MASTRTLRRYGGTLLATLAAATSTAQMPPRVRTASGAVEGFTSPDRAIRVFEGIPYAAAPVGDLRWRPPQPVAAWTGVRRATSFGARCMQGGQFDDMKFRDAGPSEDCLYLNIWTPAHAGKGRMPVMVWIHGGGFLAGSGSEPRQDGAALARKGVVVVSMNYRLGAFGFFSHPALTSESPHRASGNYGLLDQNAALRWVRANITGFGGDPANVTLFGESAGSISVSAQMASPTSAGLFARAIGESGGIAEWTPHLRPLARAEQDGLALAAAIGAPTLAALRKVPAELLHRAAVATKDQPFWPDVDGYFFAEDPVATYAAGRQARVPLLAGWNADEHRSSQFFGDLPPTEANYLAKVQAEFGAEAPAVLALFPKSTEREVETSAHDLASAEFITYSTWKWLEMQAGRGDVPVYRYRFDQALPREPGRRDRGVHHAADIAFVFESLDAQNLAWTSDHRRVSDMMATYWTNFAKSGDPNGGGLPAWPRYDPATGRAVMHLEVERGNLPQASPASDQRQYELLDRLHRAGRSDP